MTPEFVLRHTIPAALSLLPPKMDSLEARAALLVIGLQESLGFRHRVQMAGGPARGYWQFEQGGGVRGVLNHPDSQLRAREVCFALGYPEGVLAVYHALADNDVLACAFARLLLWTLPGPLAPRVSEAGGWSQYLAAWRPGKPHPETWSAHWATAWRLVDPPADILVP